MKCVVCGRGKEYGFVHKFQSNDGVLFTWAHTGCYVEDDENRGYGIHGLDMEMYYPALETVFKPDDDFGVVLVREDTGVDGQWAKGQEFFTFTDLLNKYNELVEAINDTLHSGSNT